MIIMIVKVGFDQPENGPRQGCSMSTAREPCFRIVFRLWFRAVETDSRRPLRPKFQRRLRTHLPRKLSLAQVAARVGTHFHLEQYLEAESLPSNLEVSRLDPRCRQILATSAEFPQHFRKFCNFSITFCSFSPVTVYFRSV